MIKGLKKWWSNFGANCKKCIHRAPKKQRSPYGTYLYYCNSPEKQTMYNEINETRYPCECINEYGYCSGFEKNKRNVKPNYVRQGGVGKIPKTPKPDIVPPSQKCGEK